ncbi:MAG: sigma-70 family RNA polymerase sigma factor [Pseudomonadales bacterium]|nr:sigma-70 family RNA polymerase sigma factor [Pseudomonadales bacterium]NRA14804.1 sigma-70 family RNA polymerase sigma factor [Oceanospirillaceae bacterium]
MNEIELIIEKLYKEESAKILAVLTRIFGPQNFGLAEDVLQDAFTKALLNWQQQTVPANPVAWVISCAKNQAIDVIRHNKTKLKFADDLSYHLESEWSLGNTVEQEFSETKIKDDQLRMIFACCDMDIKAENRIPFILKTLCGLSLEAIARALLQPPQVIKKRLYRTRKQLQQQQFNFPEPEKLGNLMEKVHTVLYLLFNEGFHSSEKQQPINLMFCQEAIGLAKLLIDEPTVVNQDTLGLLGLMHFQMARVSSRVDQQGFNIPIDLQDRRLWDQQHFADARQLLQLAPSNNNAGAGRFYLEALIAREHCDAANFSQTNWQAIVGLYDHLILITGSPVAGLNQAIAIAYAGDNSLGIEKVKDLQGHPALKKSHMPLAILAHLHARSGDAELAYQQADESIALGGTAHEHRLLIQQIQRQLAD